MTRMGSRPGALSSHDQDEANAATPVEIYGRVVETPTSRKTRHFEAVLHVPRIKQCLELCLGETLRRRHGNAVLVATRRYLYCFFDVKSNSCCLMNFSNSKLNS